MTKDDTIKFSLSAEETVVNDTVKIVANITGMVTPDRTEDKLREAIRDMMNRFINAQWQFAGMTRNAHASGLEQITLIATARVPEAENRALEKRSEDASEEGLRISQVKPDISFPTSLVEKTENKLRIVIVQKAKEAVKEMSAAMERAYRIKRIDFIAPFDPMSSGRVYQSQLMPMSASATKTAYGSGFDGDDVIGNAQKIAIHAVVILATDRDSGDERPIASLSSSQQG